MIDVVANLKLIKQRIHTAERLFSRPLGSVALLAVSKSQPPEVIAPLFAARQHDLGENYLQEALIKISTLSHKRFTWHFIGPIQTRKAPLIAQHFNWVHTIQRLKEAKQLSKHRPIQLGPLNICIQVKLDDNPERFGAKMEEVPMLIEAIKPLPLLTLRGLMTLPPYTQDFEEQRYYFRLVKNLFDKVNDQGKLDTLSMGMTHDLEAAIAEGSTLVRVGQGIFGLRN